MTSDASSLFDDERRLRRCGRAGSGLASADASGVAAEAAFEDRFDRFAGRADSDALLFPPAFFFLPEP